MAHWKTSCNIAIETDKFHKTNNRNNTFITSCVKDLKKKGETYCYYEWQIEEIKKRFNNILILKNDNYYIIKEVKNESN